MTVEVVLDTCKQMVACIATGDVMVAISIYLHFELYSSLHHCFGEFSCILIVYVVVGCAVNDEQVTFQFLVMMKRTGVSMCPVPSKQVIM